MTCKGLSSRGTRSSHPSVVIIFSHPSISNVCQAFSTLLPPTTSFLCFTVPTSLPSTSSWYHGQASVEVAIQTTTSSAPCPPPSQQHGQDGGGQGAEEVTKMKWSEKGFKEGGTHSSHPSVVIILCHPSAQPFTCHTCGRSFRRAQDISRHRCVTTRPRK